MRLPWAASGTKAVAPAAPRLSEGAPPPPHGEEELDEGWGASGMAGEAGADILVVEAGADAVAGSDASECEDGEPGCAKKSAQPDSDADGCIAAEEEEEEAANDGQHESCTELAVGLATLRLGGGSHEGGTEATEPAEASSPSGCIKAHYVSRCRPVFRLRWAQGMRRLLPAALRTRTAAVPPALPPLHRPRRTPWLPAPRLPRPPAAPPASG